MGFLIRTVEAAAYYGVPMGREVEVSPFDGRERRRDIIWPNVPTSVVERYLTHSETQKLDWENSLASAQRSLERATSALQSVTADVLHYKAVLAERALEESEIKK